MDLAPKLIVSKEEEQLMHPLQQQRLHESESDWNSQLPWEQLLLRARIEQGAKFQDLADQLGYPSRSAARRAFYSAQARLVIRLRQRMSRQ